MWGWKNKYIFQTWVRHSESVDGSLINPTCRLLNLAQIGLLRCSTFPHPEVKHYKGINSRSKWKQNQAKVNSIGETLLVSGSVRRRSVLSSSTCNPSSAAWFVSWFSWSVNPTHLPGKSSSNSRLKAGMLPPLPGVAKLDMSLSNIVNPFLGLYTGTRTADQLKCPGWTITAARLNCACKYRDSWVKCIHLPSSQCCECKTNKQKWKKHNCSAHSWLSALLKELQLPK